MTDRSTEILIERMGTVSVTREDATSLLAGGIVPIGDQDLADGSVDYLRYAQVVNEIDMSSNLNRLRPVPGTASCRYFLDTYYKRLFAPLSCSVAGLYGPDAACWAPPDVASRADRFARVPFRRIPVLTAKNMSDVQAIASRIRDWIPANLLMWFRGQTTPYWIRRSAAANELLYGTTEVLEPSLQSSAARATNHGSERFWQASLELQSWYYGSAWTAADAGLPEPLKKRHEEMHGLRKTDEWIESVMCLLQHYGVPTAGLDVSSNLGVGVWFATHKLSLDEQRRGRYSVDVASGDQPNAVIYLFAGTSQHVVNLANSTIASRLRARRPLAQDGLMSLGGWGANSNVAAEDVVAIVELAPEFERVPIGCQTLFPRPNEDLAYELMLGFRRLAEEGRAPEAFLDVIDYG